MPAPITSRVHFVKTDLSKTWPDILSFNDASVDRIDVAVRLRGGTNSWLVQSYLQLCRALPAAGIACTIGERFVPGAINIAHRDTLSRFRFAYLSSYVLGLRADRAPLRMCDFEVLQNEIHADSERCIGIPLWPQPGLLSRDSARGERIERIAYFGRTGTAAGWLQHPDFAARLRQMGVEFEIRDQRWYDYRDVDLILAHRLEAPVMLANKPPSKLINAWLADTPALLGDEPAFLNLRRSELDYLSIATPEQVFDAVARFKSEPRLFQAMVANGRRRGSTYSAPALRLRWVELLTQTIVPRYRAAPRRKPISNLAQLVAAYLKQRSLTHQFRARYAQERDEIARIEVAESAAFAMQHRIPE